MLVPELAAAQPLTEKPAYHIDELQRVVGSRSTAYRMVGELLEAGFASKERKGYFSLRSSYFQPYSLWEHLLPSLTALKHARYFGRSYNASDVNLARHIIEGSVTLDYRAFELTGLQTPFTLFVYADDADSAALALRRRGFWEGTRGRVVILPHVGPFEAEVQRVYFDCIAYGGRSTLDAIAIEILHGDELDQKARGAFRTEDVVSVESLVR